MAINGGQGQTPVHFIGVSIPRSGHNFVVRLLQALYPTDLFYCEFYGVPGCCQAVPCARRGTQPITFQKTHDFELNVSGDVPGAIYVIMHRVPVPAVLSAREVYADDYGDVVAADRGEYAVWLGRNAEYYVAFWERWIQYPPARSVLVDYDALSRQPAAVLRQLLVAASIEANDRAIEAAVTKIAPRGGIDGDRPYVPRSIEKSRYLDRELLAIYESIIVDHLPGLAEDRIFEAVDYQDSLTWRVFEALRVWRAGDTEAALRLLDRAIETTPDNALLRYERATLLQMQGRFAEAQSSLQRAAMLFPSHRPIAEALIIVALAAGDAAAAVEPTEMLNALVEPTLLGRLRLALVRTHGGDEAAADDVLVDIQNERPDDAGVWRYVSEIRRTRGELDEALAAIETAVRLAPLYGEPYFYRADLLLGLGRPHEAVHAVRAALVIDPKQRAWWTLLVDAYLEADDRVGALAAIDEARDQLPRDADVQAELDELRQRIPELPSLPRQPHRSRPRARRGVDGRIMIARRRPSRTQRVVQQRDEARRLCADQRRQLARLEVQLSQVRAALGIAERRLYETEVTKQRELEEAWEQTHRLDAALQEQEQATRAAWRQARLLEREMQQAEQHAQTLDEALQEKEQAMQAAWTQARALDEVLQEQKQATRAAWQQARLLEREMQQAEQHAQTLDEALQEKEQAMQAAWQHAQTLDKALQEREQAMQAAWAQANELDAHARRLRAALDELTGESGNGP